MRRTAWGGMGVPTCPNAGRHCCAVTSSCMPPSLLPRSAGDSVTQAAATSGGTHPTLGAAGMRSSPAEAPSSRGCTHLWGVHPSPKDGTVSQCRAQWGSRGVPMSLHSAPGATGWLLAHCAAVPVSPPPAAACGQEHSGCSPSREPLALDRIFLATALTILLSGMLFITPEN